MRTSQTTEDFHKATLDVLKVFLQKQPNNKVPIRPFQRNQKRTYPHGLLVTLNPKVFSKRLEHNDRLVALGPKYHNFMVPTDHTLKLPQGQLLPTATDLLRHQVPLLPRINPQTLKQTSWRPRPFALLQRRMALDCHQILEVVRTLYLEAPYLNEPPAIQVQERPNPADETRFTALPDTADPDHPIDPTQTPEYSHHCIHGWAPKQSPHSDSESDNSDQDSYHSDTDSSGTCTSELDLSNDLPDNFQYSPTSPTYSPVSPGPYPDPEVARYLTV